MYGFLITRNCSSAGSMLDDPCILKTDDVALLQSASEV